MDDTGIRSSLQIHYYDILPARFRRDLQIDQLSILHFTFNSSLVGCMQFEVAVLVLRPGGKEEDFPIIGLD